MLKFNPEVFGLHGVFPPLAGARGWNFEQLSFFYPPTLLALRFCSQQKHSQSGGENPCKPPNFVQKIIA